MDDTKQIKKHRDKLILTQTEVAVLFGLSYPTVCRWKKGISDPTTKVKKEKTQIYAKKLNWSMNNYVNGEITKTNIFIYSRKSKSNMGIATHLAGPYKLHEYGTVILPFTVLKRIDDAPKDKKQACSLGTRI